MFTKFAVRVSAAVSKIKPEHTRIGDWRLRDPTWSCASDRLRFSIFRLHFPEYLLSCFVMSQARVDDEMFFTPGEAKARLANPMK